MRAKLASVRAKLGSGGGSTKVAGLVCEMIAGGQEK